MALFKVTYIFEGPAKGWTESYVLNGVGTDHTKQVPAVVTLAKARVKLLAEPCFIKGYRISLEGTGPDALLSYDKYAPQKVALPTGDVVGLDKAADPDQAVLIRCSNATQSKHRFIYLRGVPDFQEQNYGEYQKDGKVWRKLMDSFFGILTGGPWGWMGVDDVNSVKKVPVLNVEQNANGTASFTFQANLFPITLPANAIVKIRVSGINKGSPSNGVHIVYAKQRDLAVTVNALATGKYLFGGRASYTPLTFIPIEHAEDQKVVTREAGAPLLQSRGRAKARPRG